MRNLKRHPHIAAAGIALCIAALGCADNVDTGEGRPIVEPVQSAPKLPALASVKVTENAPAFKRATREEFEAFVAKRYDGRLPPEPPAAEIDAVIADASSTDPALKQQALRRFRDMMYTLRTPDARKDAMQRMQAIHGFAERAVDVSRQERSQQ